MLTKKSTAHSDNTQEIDAPQDSIDKYLMLDHGGVLEGQIVMSAKDITSNDLVLNTYEWGGYQVLKNGVDIINKINDLVESHGYKVVFHSKNKEAEQMLILNQLKNACEIKGLVFPKVHALAVKDSELYPNVSSDAPHSFTNDAGIKVAAWGADDLNGKASVRRALEAVLKIKESERANHIIFDDGKSNFIAPKKEGYQAHLIGGLELESKELHEAIGQVYDAATTEVTQMIEPDAVQVPSLPLLLQSAFEQLPVLIQSELAHKYYGGDLESAKMGWNENSAYTRVQLLYRLKESIDLLQDDAFALYSY